FDYGKGQVTHFLLSNCKYWLEEFNFDGFRFDGVTSMLYIHHGNGKSFSNYGDYFDGGVDENAVAFFNLVNKLIHQYRPDAITVAEDVSGMPGLAAPQEAGGIGFDYRLGMGIPDFWIKTLKHTKDEDWSVDNIFQEHTNRRRDEKIISYAESHDQALVGDKTVAFWLMDAEMYWSMAKTRRNLMIDRGIALHKLIRFFTATTARGGYLNFIGNEWGHPEWIDFPREGNGWSFHCARRQWNLLDDPNLCYQFLGDFDREMIHFMSQSNLPEMEDPRIFWSHVSEHVIGFYRGRYYFIINLDNKNSYDNYFIEVPTGEYLQVFNSDQEEFGGWNRIPNGQHHQIIQREFNGAKRWSISLYLPSRTAIILEKVK
ncbi:MAG: alpha amylase C-terminal domain-containing protein, partial [Pseudomonadota bacterium]